MSDPVAIPSGAIEALAKRNYEEAMGRNWEEAPAKARNGWLNEAVEQCDIVAPYFAGER